MASIQGSGLTFAYNTFLRRELSLADLTDVTAARNVLGMSGILTPGAGLTGGSFGPGSGNVGFAVDSSSIGIPGKITMYDSSGNLTAVNTLNLGSGGATITRASGTDGNFSLTSTGAGVFSLNNGSGIIQLVTGGRFQLTAAGTDPSTITTSAGLSVSLANGATGTGLSVAGGLNVDSLYGAITDLTNGTSSTVAASAKAVATVSTAAATAQSAADAAQVTASAALPATGGTMTGAVTFNEDITITSGKKLIYSRLIQAANNGSTTTTYTSSWGTGIYMMPATNAIENVNDWGSTYGFLETAVQGQGNVKKGIFKVPLSGRYEWSFSYSATTSATISLTTNNLTTATVSTYATFGPGTVVSASGTIELTKDVLVAFTTGTAADPPVALSVSTLAVNRNYISFRLTI